MDISEAKRRVGDQVVLQGNMDPVVMSTSADAVRDQATAVLAGYGDHDDHSRGHIFNLGHGIQPSAKPENMQVLVDTVRSESVRFYR